MKVVKRFVLVVVFLGVLGAIGYTHLFAQNADRPPASDNADNSPPASDNADNSPPDNADNSPPASDNADNSPPASEVKDAPSNLSNSSPLELYQDYYVLQSQRDSATERHNAGWRAAFWEEQSVKKQLASDSSDIELHRRLIRAQNEQEKSKADWYTRIQPLDDRMDTIREELKSRGEPQPR